MVDDALNYLSPSGIARSSTYSGEPSIAGTRETRSG